ncbi:MAG: gamma carbonic anhydrase family protein [Pseudomonadota bacterium]|nr:gamma carbonic anhydrase family protein [Pseudomonadota bacterium]
MPLQKYKNYLPDCHKTAFIHESAYLIGNVEVGSYSSIWPHAVLRGDVAAITVGENTNIQDGTIIHGTHAGEYTGEGKGTSIGNNVTIGHRATLHACNIEDYAFVGINSVILDNATIRTGAMLGANSLVTSKQDITGGYLWIGQPAKKVRELTQKEKDYILYSASHYVKVAIKHQESNI